MADTILLRVEIDEGDAQKTVDDLKKSLAGLRKEQQEADRLKKSGILSAEGYAKATAEIKSRTDEVNKALKAKSDSLKASIQAEKEATSSLKSLEESTSQLIDRYKELTAAERAGAEGLNLADRIATQNTELEKQSAVLNKTKKSLSDYVGEFEIFGVSINSVKEGLENTKSALDLTKTGLSGVKAAIASTGIGVLLIAIGALVNFLTQTQTGMDFVARKTRALQAVFALASRAVSALGEFIVNAFDKPGDALKAIGDIIKDNLTARVDAFKKILDGVAKVDLKAIGKGLLQLFTGIRTEKVEEIAAAAAAAAAAGDALEASNQRLRISERDLEVRTAARRAEIEKLKKTAEDTNKSLAEREAAARKASDIEVGLLQEQIALQEKKIENAKKDLELGGDPNNEEKLNKIAEERIRLKELEADSIGRQTELLNQLNQIREEAFQKQIAGEIRAADLSLKLQQDQLKKFKDRIYEEYGARLDAGKNEQQIRREIADQEIALMEETFKKQQEVDLLNLKQQKLSAEEFAKQKKEIEIRTAQEIAAATKEINDAALDARERTEATRARTRIIRARKGSEDELKAKKDQIDAEADIEKTQASRTIRDLAELEAKKAEIDAAAKEGKENLDKEYLLAFIESTLNAASLVASTVSSFYEAQIAVATKALDDQQEAALKSAGANAELREQIEADFEKKREELEKDAGEKRRKVARVEALINTAVAVTKALTLGPILGPILAAVVAAQGIAQQALIGAQQFAEGGVYELKKNGPLVRGPGGPREDRINAKLSNGEAVMNARTTARRYQELSEYNEEGGGARFPGAKPMGTLVKGLGRSFNPVQIQVSRQFMPGYAAGGVQMGTARASVDTQALADALAPVLIAGIQQIPPQNVNLVEFMTKTDALKSNESSNDLKAY